MSKKVGPNDIDAFLSAIKGVKPLTTDKVKLKPKITPPKPAHRASFNNEINSLEPFPLDPVQGEEFITFKHSSISNKTLRNLRKGQYNVEAMLDLHGMKVEEAKTAVESFIAKSLDAGMRVVLIIHGKGHHSEKPVLKNKLNLWLRQLEVVLAFCSANKAHGSRGATYVMLKRTI